MTLGPGIARTLLPLGFQASGVNCGVRRYRPDLGLITSDKPCVAAGVFTLNTCQAAPVQYSKSLLPSSNIMAVITNSGQANAATGQEGLRTNQMMIDAVASQLGCDSGQVLAASTGVIGQPLAVDKIVPAIRELIERQTDTAENFALSILTTDLVPKTVTTSVRLSTGSVRITGICKGSGMIHPNMGTMLGYILTDAQLEQGYAHRVLRAVNDMTFNMISVDGDSSTNDCVFLLANGMSGHAVATTGDQDLFEQSIFEVMRVLAQSIAIDGEGATKLIEVNILGSPNLEFARRCARSITLSPLIKTAIHGEDPNWGRILARIGAEQAPPDIIDTMELKIQGKAIFNMGAPLDFSREDLKTKLKASKVQIDIDFKSGNFSATAWGCDLSKKYVEINTEYS